MHRTEVGLRGEPNLKFLRRTFNKLLLNSTWWVNRKESFGKNVFEGGFLRVDNIGVFGRITPLPTVVPGTGRLARLRWRSWLRTCTEAAVRGNRRASFQL